MLPEQLGRLISAYVDGELSPEQVNAVHRLLKHSDEARLLLGQFRANVRRLRSLPQVALPRDFSQSIVQRLPAGTSRPISITRPRAIVVPVWVAVACAAAFLLAVASSSYIYFSRSQGRYGTERDSQMCNSRLGRVSLSRIRRLSLSLRENQVRSP